MLEAALPDDVELAVLAHRAFHEARQRCALQSGQVLTGQVADEIGRGEDGLAVDQLHAMRSSPWAQKGSRWA